MLLQTKAITSYDKKYYSLAIGQILFVLIFRSLSSYVWYLSCNQTYTEYVANTSHLLRNEAMFYMPVVNSIFIGLANIGFLWSALEKNFNVRMINFGTLLLMSGFSVLVQVVFYGAYNNDLDSYNLALEGLMGVMILIVLFINCFNDNIKKKPIEKKLFDVIIGDEYDL